VRRAHFERLSPVCPTCAAQEREPARLELGTVAREDGEDVLEGVLVCTDTACLREHPIIDGIPVVVADLASWASHQLDAVLRREDLSPFTESLLGDAAGPASVFEHERRNLSGYATAHWEGEFAGLVETALGLAGGPPAGLWADLGCATGRGTLELARRTGDLAVGVDLSFSMLRVAEGVRRTSRAVYPRRRIGVVYERRDLAVENVPADRMSFWCADVTALPFASGTFAGALSLNVVDCVHSPLAHLMELARVAGESVLSTPYDWSIAATPFEQWLGGHSQRAAHGGDGAAELRRAAAYAGLDVGAERDHVPWRVYVNERSSMDYALHVVALSRSAPAP
jgi:SAM-dependent methyltransferase